MGRIRNSRILHMMSMRETLKSENQGEFTSAASSVSAWLFTGSQSKKIISQHHDRTYSLRYSCKDRHPQLPCGVGLLHWWVADLGCSC
jgi:hypothetical protein